MNFWPIATLICLALSVTSAALAQDVVGSISEIKGTAQLERDGHNLNPISAMPIKLHDKLHTTSDANLTITLNSGSRVMLFGSSSIVINNQSFVNQSRDHFMIDLLVGHVRCTVVKVPLMAISGFEVHAPNAIVVARGTEFEVAHILGKSCPDSPPCRRYTDVSVYKGIVEVNNPADPTLLPVRVRQGYETEVPCELPPTSPNPLGMNELGTSGY